MAELTIQDVADYLANNGYTTWADLTRQKTLTETGLWSILQHNYDSNHAINMGYVDLSDYLSETAMKQWVQGCGYVTESSIKSWVQAQGYITSVPGTDLTGYATQQWVLGRGFLTSHQSLADYATKQYADSKIIGLASQSWVSQNYATQAALSKYLPLSGGTMTGGIESQNIIPVTDNTYSLGTSTKRWSIIRTVKADFAGEIYTHGKIYAYGNIQPMPNSNNAYPQLGTSAARWANVLTSGVNSAGHIIPATTETYQLGTSQYRWNNVVTKSINATGTSSLAALSVSGSATFNNGINVATGSLTIGSCTISWDSSVGMLRFSTGIYSDGAVTAGGGGTSGGGGGGGLSWENLASTVAAAGEQVNICHLTEALAGYATTSMLGGYALTSQLPTKLSDLTDDLGSSPTHTHSQYLTALPSHNHDSRYYISGGTVHLGNGSITPLTSHQSLAGYATTSQLAGYLPLSGGTLTGQLRVKAGSTVIGPSLDDTTYRYYHAVYFGTHGTDHMDFYEGEFNFYGNGGGKPTVKIGGYRVLDTSDAGSLSVAFATNSKHIEPLAYASSNGVGMTVAQVKSWIASQFDGISHGVGSNVYVSADAIWNWYDDSHTVVDSSVYSFIKIGGGYSGTYWGQWMLSSFNDNRVGFVGRSEGVWSNIQWIALLTDNVASATRLQYTRYLWGQAFDGTGNVSGPLTGVTSVSSSDSGERFRMAYSTSKQTLSGVTLPFSGSTNVLKIEHYNGESAGIAISEPDGVCVFGPGDGDYIFSVYDEDDFEECLFYVDGDGVTCANSLKIGSCEIDWDSSAQMLRFSTGIYSVGAVTAGGVGTSGGGGGGGLSWANLAAATTEQIALSHLTTALSGYLTSYGNRPSIGMAGSSITWIPENYGVILPLVSAGAGNYQLDLSGYAKTTDLHSHTNKSVLDGITSTKVSNWDTAYGWGNHASAGYVTGYGYRPSIGNLSDSGVTWLSASAYVVMPLVHNAGAGYYQLNLSNYVKTSGNNTFSGTNTFNKEIYMSGTRSIVFNDDSGIAANRSDELELYGNNGVRITSNTVVEGKVTATGFINSSDLRMKNLFGDVGLSVADIAAMPAVRFRWNSGRDTAMHVGTIAQAWQTLLPEVVLEGSDGLLSMDYASAALVSVINVAKSVNEHERRILDLEAENKRLKEELEQLKSA